MVRPKYGVVSGSINDSHIARHPTVDPIVQILQGALEVGPIRIGHDLIDVALVGQFRFGGRVSFCIAINRWACARQINAKPEERIGATIHILVIEDFWYW